MQTLMLKESKRGCRDRLPRYFFIFLRLLLKDLFLFESLNSVILPVNSNIQYPRLQEKQLYVLQLLL
jgi:hypothetical protein